MPPLYVSVSLILSHLHTCKHSIRSSLSYSYRMAMGSNVAFALRSILKKNLPKDFKVKIKKLSAVSISATRTWYQRPYQLLRNSISIRLSLLHRFDGFLSNMLSLFFHDCIRYNACCDGLPVGSYFAWSDFLYRCLFKPLNRRTPLPPSSS